MTLRENNLHVYNTLSRAREKFEPINPPHVGMYVCGPTVYGDTHLGHAKSYISFDIIVRYLRYLGYKVRYVQNITDVGHLTDDADEGEDKVEREAKAAKVHPMQIAERFTRRYFEDMDALGALRPDISPRASGHVIEQIEHTKRLIETGHAYEANGSVYFDVASWPAYGKLSGRSVEAMRAGARVEANPDKKHPADFALWKRAEPGHIMQWPSPWGMGYPGWHIECTVMSQKYLGETFDIHGGGIENQFPHHEDEIAQAEAATPGAPGFAKYWLHNNMVTVAGKKMGKSLGNFLTLRDAYEKWDPMVLRLFILQSHYRSPTDFSEEAIGAAATGYERLSRAFENIASLEADAVDRPLLDTIPTEAKGVKWKGEPPTDTRAMERLQEAEGKFQEAMDDDFGTPGALAAVFEVQGVILREAIATILRPPNRWLVKRLRDSFEAMACNVLGFAFGHQEDKSTEKLLTRVVNILFQQREAARNAQDFETADAIRAQLDNAGITIEDTSQGPRWRRKQRISYKL
ncbi:MAG: cysteine--tRNA ligase [Phycisphaerae bacterium]